MTPQVGFSKRKHVYHCATQKERYDVRFLVSRSNWDSYNVLLLRPAVSSALFMIFVEGVHTNMWPN